MLTPRGYLLREDALHRRVRLILQSTDRVCRRIYLGLCVAMLEIVLEDRRHLTGRHARSVNVDYRVPPVKSTLEPSHQRSYKTKKTRK